jgi:hypothetical protein
MWGWHRTARVRKTRSRLLICVRIRSELLVHRDADRFVALIQMPTQDSATLGIALSYMAIWPLSHPARPFSFILSGIV